MNIYIYIYMYISMKY